MAILFSSRRPLLSALVRLTTHGTEDPGPTPGPMPGPTHGPRAMPTPGHPPWSVRLTPNDAMPEYGLEVPLEVESSPGNRIGALRLLLLAALTPVLLAAQCAIHEAAHYAVALTQGGHVRFAQFGYWRVYPQPAVRMKDFDLLLGFADIWNPWPMMMADSTTTLVVALIIALVLPRLSNTGLRWAATALGLVCLADLPFSTCSFRNSVSGTGSCTAAETPNP